MGMNSQISGAAINVKIPANEVVICLKGLTFLKGVLIGGGFSADSSSINRIEILYSILKKSLADGLADSAIAK